MILSAKVILIGNGTVGKTSLRNKFMGKGFKKEYLATLGADLSINHLPIKEEGEEHMIKLSIWDLAGQPEFDTVRSSYYIGTHAIICVYDITNRKSFNDITLWINKVQEFLDLRDIPILIIGNKSDLRDSTMLETISINETKSLVKDLSQQYYENSFLIPFVETSALNGQNVNKAFEMIGKQFLKMHTTD